MLYLLLVTVTLLQSGKTVLFKKIGVDSRSSKQFFRLNGLSFGVATVIAAIISFILNPSVFKDTSFYSVWMSALFALSSLATILAQMKALSLGTTSSTMMIFSCGFLIPVIFSAIAYEEKISVIDIFALALMLIALFLIINPDKKAKLSVKWLVYSLVAMTCSGTTAILQKIHQHSSHAHEFLGLSVSEFLIACLLLLGLYLFAPKASEYKPMEKGELSFGLINGFFVSVPSMINIFLAGKFPAIIMFPIYNIGNIVLSGIIGGIIYREKNSKKEIFGFILGCIAILLIGIL